MFGKCEGYPMPIPHPDENEGITPLVAKNERVAWISGFFRNIDKF
jgi:hypothetical protein